MKRYEGVGRKDFGIAFVRKVDQLEVNDDFWGSSEDDVTAASEAIVARTGTSVVRIGLGPCERGASLQVKIDEVQRGYEQQQDCRDTP